MSDNTYNLVRYFAGGIGTLLFIGLLTWCHLEEIRMNHGNCKSCPPCKVEKVSK